ncbi:MAG: hypothetical protein ACKV2O_07200 [Acidimicrobiales bacterium]
MTSLTSQGFTLDLRGPRRRRERSVRVGEWARFAGNLTVTLLLALTITQVLGILR